MNNRLVEQLQALTGKRDAEVEVQTDIARSTEDYITLLLHEAETTVGRMRHRAGLMRERANELDREADKIIKDSLAVKILTQNVESRIGNAEATLQQMVHIEPTREDGNGGGTSNTSGP